MREHPQHAKTARFDALVVELHELTKPASDISLESSDQGVIAEIHLDNETFHLTQRAGTDTFTIYCELNDVDDLEAPATLRHLLELNLALATGQLGSIAIDRGCDRAVLVVPAPSSMTATDLLRALQHIAAQVTQWRACAYRSHGDSADARPGPPPGFLQP